MVAVVLVVSCLSVFGFYGYVLLQFQQEQKQLKAHKKRLSEHLYEMEPESSKRAAERHGDPDSRLRATTLPETKAQELMRRETLIQLSLAVGGLAAVFAGIEIFNS